MRNLGLDIVRFVAVMLVLGRHLQGTDNASTVLQLWHRGGWIGVDLFFVLSGFLVSSLLFKEFQRTGTADIKRFLVRRAFKIYPAFWVFLAFSFFIFNLRGDFIPTQNFFGEVLFLQNYLGGMWHHTWSLAVEEHFYLGLAILFLWLVPSRESTTRSTQQESQPLKHLPICFAIIACICMLFRLSNLWLCPEYSHDRYLFGTHLRVDSLFYGVLLSYLWHFHHLEDRIKHVSSWALYSSGALLLSPAFLFTLETDKWLSVGGVIMFYVGSGNILLAALRTKESPLASLNFLQTLGAASYSVYLWHMPVNYWAFPAVQMMTGADSYLAYLITYIVGSFAFGWMMNRMIEAPVLLLRDRYYPATRQSRSPQAALPVSVAKVNH